MSAADRAFDPANWRAHYAGVKARLSIAACRPVIANAKPRVIIRYFVRHISESEARHNEYVYLSALAAAADSYCAGIEARKQVSVEALSRPTVRQIILEVCQLTGFTYNDIISQRRQAALALARQFAIWRSKNETLNSYPQIGRRFGGRDHSTAIWAVQKIDQLICDGRIPQHWLATCLSERHITANQEPDS